MRCVFFYHAFTSCWNNGNAHFLRGIARELHALGHDVIVYEPADGWSRLNAIRDDGTEMLRQVLQLFPGIDIKTYDASLDLDEALDAADLVVVHEWNSPDLVRQVGRRRTQGGDFALLFHDTHHRAVTAPEQLEQFDLDGFDGVLAFGEVLRLIYLRLGWANRAFTWHEAADTKLYHPLPEIERQHDIVWVGNWGDGERGAELFEYLINPTVALHLRTRIYGVRYPSSTLRDIAAATIQFGGWLPAHLVPEAFAAARATVHVPRGPYARALPGIPTIRMFEAMACGIPLVSAPWDDVEKLFPPGSYLRAADPAQMTRALQLLRDDPELASATAESGLRIVRARHTCAHRVRELLDIVQQIQGVRRQSPARAEYEGAAS